MYFLPLPHGQGSLRPTLVRALAPLRSKAVKLAGLPMFFVERVHGVVLLPWEVQIEPEAQRLIAWPQTDPEPGLGMLGVFPRMAVPLQRRSGNANRGVVAVNGEAGATAAQTHGDIMIFAISYALLGKLFDAGADLKHSVLAERQQREAKVDSRGIRLGFDCLDHAPQCRRAEPRQDAFGGTVPAPISIAEDVTGGEVFFTLVCAHGNGTGTDEIRFRRIAFVGNVNGISSRPTALR